MIPQKKATVRGVVEYLEAKNIPHFKSRIFDHFEVFHRQGWAMISEGSKDRRHHRAEGGEHRGRPSKITNWNLQEMDRVIKEEGLRPGNSHGKRLVLKLDLKEYILVQLAVQWEIQ
ncbi:hypothetical protein EJ02DRAFT_63509 [Clathrospora elynae]|uniref:Uncharacterized protein n=1 Tax=Clathrospora elynae TaxID=706981 RepID=A0A6A5SBW2_9PLEO|nr:hypothetical protein EJ02DRAFT_63509 [Clathrospora elynae]